MSCIKIEVGDTVRLKRTVRRDWTCPEGRDNNTTAKVRDTLERIPGGLHLDRDLHGCRYWNVADVELVEKGSDHGTDTRRS